WKPPSKRPVLRCCSAKVTVPRVPGVTPHRVGRRAGKCYLVVMNLLKDRHGEGDDGCAHAAHRSASAPDALADAEAARRSRGARLTPIRRDVLGVLYSTHRPLG